MNRNSKVIKGIGVVALSGVVATSALTMTSCGKKTSKADSVVITLADEENNGEECLSSQWLPLSQITTNSDFRESFNTLTHNRTASSEASASTSTSNQKKEGTIYYLENPTLATSLKNTAFTNLFDSLDTTTLLSLTQDLYLDLDETTSPDILKAAVINTYFDLFNTKQSQSQNEFNATQRISRVDFISAVVKSTTSPQSNEENISESEIMLKLSDKSYLGNNTTNNTETGIITKAEAAYMIASCMFNSEMKEVKADKPAENLQSCLESSELSSDLKEAMSILESKKVIDESFVGSWNKALTKSEAIDLIYKSLSVKGSLDGGAVNEDVIAEEEAARVAALAEKKETGKTLIGGYSRISLDEWNEKIEAAETEEEVDVIVDAAGVEESDAIEAEKAAAEAAKKSSGKKKIATTNGEGNGGNGGGTSSTTPSGSSSSGSSDFELPPGVTIADPNDGTWGGDGGHSNDDFGNMGYGF